MGGYACYQKILHDNNIISNAYQLIMEAQTTKELLAAKEYDDSPMLQQFIEADKEITDFLNRKISLLKELNAKYSQE